MKHLNWAIIALIILAGCGNSNNESASEEMRAEEQAQTNEENKHSEAKEELQLNNGKRWETDQSTRKGMEKIDKLVRNYNNRENLKIKDYNQLGQQIQNHMKTIHQECSMEGKSHEELHKFIAQIHPHIKELQVDKKAKAESAFNAIKKLMDKYKKHFK